MPLKSIYHATEEGVASELRIMRKNTVKEGNSVGFCARWSKTKIMSNLALVVEGILLKEIKMQDGCTLNYPMFWSVEHAYVAIHKFGGNPEAVRLLTVGGKLSSFENMHNNNIETHELKVE